MRRGPSNKARKKGGGPADKLRRAPALCRNEQGRHPSKNALQASGAFFRAACLGAQGCGRPPFALAAPCALQNDQNGKRENGCNDQKRHCQIPSLPKRMQVVREWGSSPLRQEPGFAGRGAVASGVFCQGSTFAHFWESVSSKRAWLSPSYSEKVR